MKTDRPKAWDRGAERPTQLWPLKFWQKCLQHVVGQRQPVQPMVPAKLRTRLQKSGIDPHLSHCIKINSKWMKDLNLKPHDTGNAGGKYTVQDSGAGKNFK